MKKLLIVAIAVISLTLGGCSTVKPIETQVIEVAKTPLALPNPAPLSLSRIDWHVITIGNEARVFGELAEKGIDPILFGLTDDDYALISLNFEKIRAYIVQQKNLLNQYRLYYEGVPQDATIIPIIGPE